jgi:DNA-binding transcriptional regulator YiaG
MERSIFPSDAELRQLRADIYRPEVATPAATDEDSQRLYLERRAKDCSAYLGGIIVSLAVDGLESEEFSATARHFNTVMEDIGLSELTPELYALNPAFALRFERRRLGLPQKQIARQLGISVTLLSRLESGERRSPHRQADIRELLASGKLEIMAGPLPVAVPTDHGASRQADTVQTESGLNQ